MMKHHADESYFFMRGSLFCMYVITSAYLALRVRSCVYHCADQHILALQIAQCFVGMTIPISIYHAWEHLTNFVRPRLQTQIVRIIWIVPIYAFESLLSISFMEHAFYFQAIREIYESYVIYCFMRFLLHFLGDGRNLVDRLALMPAHMGHHKAPFCWIQPWQMGSDFLRNCKAGVFQFVIVKFLLAVLTLFLRIVGCYEEGNYNTNSSYLWITGLCGASQSWAFYSLCMFYNCSYNDLITMRPFMKFFCLKMVIFFCWWQGVAIGLLVKLGQINSAHGHSVQEVADLIQDLLISMEMLVAAIAFFNSFPIMEFANVRQFNWNPLAIAPPTSSSSSSAVQPAVKILESSVPSPKKALFIPAVGVVIKSTAISSPSHALNVTISGCSNSNNNSSSNSSTSSSSGSSSSDALLTQSNLESEISHHIMPEISTSLRSQSPVSDCGQSPSVYSSRKVFLPYALPAPKSDGKEQNVSHDKKGRPAVGQGQRATLESDTETGRAIDFTTRLSALRGAGYDLLRGVVPSLIPSSSFAISIKDSKKRQRHNSPPPNPSLGGEGEEEEEGRRRSDSRGALADNRSDSSPATYIHRSLSYSHEALTPLLIAGQGGRHGDDAGGVSAMGLMMPKGLPSITAHGSGSGGISASSSSQHQHQHQHASDIRGSARGFKGTGADNLPSPPARRRAAKAYQTGSINNSIINSANNNARQLNNTPCKCNNSDTSDDSHTDSHLHSRLQGSSPVPPRESPMASRGVRSPIAHATTHRGSGRKSVSPDMMEARKNANHSNTSMGAREGALTDSQKAKNNPDTASAQSQPYLRSHSPARVVAKKDMDYCAAYLTSSAFQSTTSLSSSSSASSRSCPTPPSATKDMHYNGGGCFDDHNTAHNSSCIYHTLSRDGARDYARDPLLREERDDLRNERGHFIGSSSSNNTSGVEGSGGSGMGGRMSMGSAVLGQSHQQSPLQALVTCTMPRELHEDIQELGLYVADSYITPPYAAMRKWVKGSAMS